MGFEYGLLVPLFGIVMIIAIVFITAHYKSKAREEMQKTLRLSIEKGQPLPPELINSLKSAKLEKAPDQDIRSGIILLAISASFLAWSYLDEGYFGGGKAGVAAILGFIGIALLILGVIGKNSKS